MSSALYVELWHKLLRRGRAQTDLAAFSHSKLMLGRAGCSVVQAWTCRSNLVVTGSKCKLQN